jgi:hypothetical protein
LRSCAARVSEWGEESSGAILRDLLRLEGRVTILQFIRGVPKTAATAKITFNERQALLFFKNPFTSRDFS